MLEFYLPGTQVVLKGDLAAGITSVKIQAGNRVRYKVFWFEQGKRKNWRRVTAWVDAAEVIADGIPKVQIETMA